MPLLILLMWLPFTPPPTKNVMAWKTQVFVTGQKPPVIKPADPFDDINVMTPQRMRMEAEHAIPKLISVRGYLEMKKAPRRPPFPAAH